MKYILAFLVAVSLSAQAQSTWKMHIIDNASNGADGVKLADINHDGRLDIVTGWEEGGITKLYLQPETKLNTFIRLHLHEFEKKKTKDKSKLSS